MFHIVKSDRWIGYAALICAVVVFPANRTLDSVDPAAQGGLIPFFIWLFLTPLGLYFALRGVFVGHWPSRVCAGVALVFFIWLVYSYIMEVAGMKTSA
jgi:prepilin signal peptidase PulO-like enzyme (type II secretory pathway)